MPSTNDLRRAVRARMAATGENYTTARRHVLAGAERARTPVVLELEEHFERSERIDAAEQLATWLEGQLNFHGAREVVVMVYDADRVPEHLAGGGDVTSVHFAFNPRGAREREHLVGVALGARIDIASGDDELDRRADWHARLTGVTHALISVADLCQAFDGRTPDQIDAEQLVAHLHASGRAEAIEQRARTLTDRYLAAHAAPLPRD